MGTIVLHAGMPKTGSTSIQAWLGQQAQWLRDELQCDLVKDVGDESAVRFESYDPATSGHTPGSMRFGLRYRAALHEGSTASVEELARGFTAELDRRAQRGATVLVTSEALAPVFHRQDEVFLRTLEQLASRHRVRVAYYVRPQDAALEARWRQWGYRSPLPPSEWIRNEARKLHYWETARAAAEMAPSLHFDVRPFRRDLLDGGDVVRDFAQHFLGLPGDDQTPAEENPALPLDLAILLRSAPADLMDEPSTGGGRVETGWHQQRLGVITRGWGIPDSRAATRSREVLTCFAHDTFEASNARLIRQEGWNTERLVSCPGAETPPADLHELDDLWTPRASSDELRYLHEALRRLLAA